MEELAYKGLLKIGSNLTFLKEETVLCRGDNISRSKKNNNKNSTKL